MTKKAPGNLFDEVFFGEHITILLNMKTQTVNEEEETIESGYAVAQGILVGSDDQYLYLTPDTQIGATEAVRKSVILRVLLTDVVSDESDGPQQKKEDMN